MKNQRNWLKQVWMLKFWIVINCIFVHWTKKLTLAPCTVLVRVKVWTWGSQLYILLWMRNLKKKYWMGTTFKSPSVHPLKNDNATLMYTLCLQIAAWTQKFPPRIWAFDKNYATSSKQCYGPYIYTILIADFYYHHFILSHHNFNHVLLNKESQTYQLDMYKTWFYFLRIENIKATIIEVS